MNRVWLISDGNPGHYNQSRGIAETIQELLGWPIDWITVKPRYRGFLRSSVRFLVERFGASLGAGTARLLFAADAIPEGHPSLIISSGGKTAVFNALMARHFGCPNVFIGPPPIAPRLFTRILLIESHYVCDNCQPLSFLPTPVTAQRATTASMAFRAEHRLEPGTYWALLIGGNSRSHHYTGDEWRQLAAAMNQLSQRHGIRWLVTSSRRTGREIETLLQQSLDATAVAHATWWGENPAKVVQAYLGTAEAAFCTQDSLTMLTDGMGAGKPVIALYPRHVALDNPRAQFFVDYIQRNVEMNRIRRVAIADLAHFSRGTLEEFDPLRISVSQEIFETSLKDLVAPSEPAVHTKDAK